MVSADLPRWADHKHEPVRNNLLFIGWSARVSRDCWAYLPFRSDGVHAAWGCSAKARLSYRRAVYLLAFRGCSVGCGFHCRLHHWTLEKGSEEWARSGRKHEQVRRATSNYRRRRLGRLSRLLA